MLVKNFWEIVKKNKMDLEQIPIRKGFGEGLMLAGKQDERVVALCADLTDSTQIELFKKNFPSRFFEMGVSEQNMASVASGMAAMGKIPFISSYSMFSPGRNWEQIRTTILYNNVPVKIAGNHAGLSPGPDGGTHQALEDVAILRVIPNIVIVVPCDAVEAKKATLAISEIKEPGYLRLFREKSPVITEEETPFEIGKANIMYESQTPAKPEEDLYPRFSWRLGIIANGEMVSRALFCIKELESLGIEVGVLNLHTVKPIDTKSILEFANKYKNILTIEEHQIAGGMGSAVLECLAQNNSLENIKLNMLGVDNKFGQTGTKEELYEEYGLNEKHIIQKVKKFLEI